VRCAQNMTRRGAAGKGSRNEGCKGAELGQTLTKDCTGALGVRAALESAVQRGARRRSEQASRHGQHYEM
jgi:hypothetical protein